MARFAPRPTYANVVSTVCLILVLGGSALAADSLTGAGTAQQQVYVCVKKSGKGKGQMRVVAVKTKCKKAERKLSWAAQGPAGPAGPAGPSGSSGVSAAGASGVSSGAVEFYALTQCPAGWSTYEPARGRYVVGVNPGGNVEGAVGTALDDAENRPVGQHNHGVNDPGHRHRVLQASPILVGGNVVPQRIMGTTSASQLTALPDNPASLQQALSNETTGITLDPAGSVPGTNAPYVQLLACKKD
jgi:hypothetical protein